MTRSAIFVEGLGKRFLKRRADRPPTFKEALLSGFRGSRAEYFWGMRGIGFTARPGRAIGVVGRNGAGKSTLLRLIGGVGVPDEGRIEVSGRLGALLDLGAGMTNDLTGRENVYIAGVIGGMTRAQVRERFDEIVSFAELDEFIESPLRTYSTGMRMRLAFAVAIHIDPDVLLIDEVLAVGDIAFQRKCLAKVSEFKRAGCTIFLVSHDPAQIRALCDDILYLKDGRQVAFGPTLETMALYERTTADGERADASGQQRGASEAAASILAARLTSAQGDPLDTIMPGAPLSIEIDYVVNAPLRALKASVSVKREDHLICFDSNTDATHVEPPAAGRARLRLVIERLDLAPGSYFVSVGLYDEHWQICHDAIERSASFVVVGQSVSGLGILNPPCRWGVASAAPSGSG